MAAESPESRLVAFGPNEWLVDEIYEQFLTDRNSVDPAWWEFFEGYAPTDYSPLSARVPEVAAPAPPEPAESPEPTSVGPEPTQTAPAVALTHLAPGATTLPPRPGHGAHAGPPTSATSRYGGP